MFPPAPRGRAATPKALTHSLPLVWACRLAHLRGLQIGGNVAGLVEHGITGFDRHLLDEFTYAELLLPDYFNPDNVFIRIEVQHDQTFFRTEGFCGHYFGVAQPDISCRRFRVDFDDRRLGDRNHKTFKLALPSIR